MLNIFYFYFYLSVHKCTSSIYEQQVMSPTKRGAGAAYPAEPDVVTDGPNKTDDHYLEEKSAVPVAAMDQMWLCSGTYPIG